MVTSYKNGEPSCCQQITNYRFAIMIKGSVVRGHHLYKEVGIPVIGGYPVLAEPTNCYDKRAVAIH